MASVVRLSATTSTSENLGFGPGRRIFPRLSVKSLAKSLQMTEIFTKFEMRLRIRRFEFNSLNTIKLLKISDMRNFLYVVLASN